MEKYGKKKELHCKFIDLEKAYDRVLREELWYCMRKSGVAEKHVRLVRDMHGNSVTVVRSATGVTKGFTVKVGLHQGSALSSFLFAIVMDRLTDDVRQEAPWTMLFFADDIVICQDQAASRGQSGEVERDERRGMKVSRSNTECMCVNGSGNGKICLQKEELKKVNEFKYLGTTMESNGEYSREVKNRIQVGWSNWRRVSAVIHDRRVPAKVKGKVYKTVVRPSMLYGLESAALTKKQEAELEVAELKMLRFLLGVTRMDKIKNEYIWGTVHVKCFGDKTREARLRWFGHVKKREEEYIGRKVLAMELPGKRGGGRPMRRFMDAVREDMEVVKIREKDVLDRRKGDRRCYPLWRPLME